MHFYQVNQVMLILLVEGLYFETYGITISFVRLLNGNREFESKVPCEKPKCGYTILAVKWRP